MPVANTTRTVPWVESHCPFKSSPQCQRCCCIVPFSLSHFNLKVTDLNSTEQQWAPPSSGSVRTYLLGYLYSMKYIIVYMVHTPYGIYHLQLYIIGKSHLHPVTYHLIPCYLPKKMIHTMLYTIQIGVYSEARIGQTCIYQTNWYIPWHIPWYVPWHIPWYILLVGNLDLLLPHGIYHGIYHGTYQVFGKYNGIYRSQGVI